MRLGIGRGWPRGSPDYCHVVTEHPPLTLTRRRLSVDSHVVDVRGSPHRDGPAIVMVHGIGVSGDYFLPFARVLAPLRQVHLLDLPGYGTTPKPSRPLNVPELADVAVGTITPLGLVDRSWWGSRWAARWWSTRSWPG